MPASKLAAPAVLARLELHGLGPARVPAGDGRGQALPAQEQRRAARDRQAHRQGRLEAQARRARRGLARPTATGASSCRSSRAARASRARSTRSTPRPARSSGSGCCRRARESSPVFDNDRIYFGSENGTVYSLRAGDGAVRWKFKASGAVKSGLALADGKLFFGDYAGRVYAIRQTDGGQVWSTGTKRRRASAWSRATSTRRPRSPTAASTSATPTAACTRSPSSNGKLAWTKGTGSYVYASPAVAPGARREADGLLRLLRRHASTPSTRATARSRWTHRDGGKISGGATVVGDIVYFSNYGKKDTTGLGVRTGRKVFTWAAARSTPSSPTGARSS